MENNELCTFLTDVQCEEVSGFEDHQDMSDFYRSLDQISQEFQDLDSVIPAGLDRCSRLWFTPEFDAAEEETLA
jgi:hypothetical protein